MPGARPSLRRQAVGGRSRGQVPSASPGGPVLLRHDLAGTASRDASSIDQGGRGGRSNRRTPAGGPLLRRAAGLILGLAVLIPAATAWDGSPGSHGNPAPSGRPPVAAGTSQH
ncbi:hypothetical protein ND748_26015 [Frankia sp. AiPs1]|uniref:hypothetical protein n=1 Tax=Frankia sp. AiPs1 TaxID=573493 RepID=UPI002044A195|nr:hypothetical protein [Frankia sp. AiPs1]MCM3925110.1 hypothetical protein [Frankia sp. AiPs1]